MIAVESDNNNFVYHAERVITIKKKFKVCDRFYDKRTNCMFII